MLCHYFVRCQSKCKRDSTLPALTQSTSRIEVSKLYYDRKYGDAPPNTRIDLSFASMLKDINIPALAEHDAFNDALMTAMMYVALRDMKQRGIRIPRLRTHAVFDPTGA